MDIIRNQDVFRQHIDRAEHLKYRKNKFQLWDIHGGQGDRQIGKQSACFPVQRVYLKVGIGFVYTASVLGTCLHLMKTR